MTVKPDLAQGLHEAIEDAACDVRFDPDAHRYFAPGRTKERELPSVTSILESAGFADWLQAVNADKLEYARLRGEYVHAATELLDKDDLDWDSLDEPIRPYVEAYAKWKREADFVPFAIERPLANHRIGFAGKPDRVGMCESFPAVLDIKSGGKSEAHRIQLAGYTLLTQPYPMRRIVLYLKDDGTFRCEEFPLNTLGDDAKVFRSALEIARWKRARKT